MDIKAFMGVRGSGKDYQCNELMRNGYLKLSFADPVRAIVAEQLGLELELFTELYDTLKENKLYLKTETGNTLAAFDGRKLFRGLGQGLKVYLGQRVWAKILEQKLVTAVSHKVNKICIQDCRMWYELEFLLKKNADVKFTNYISDRYMVSDNPPATEHFANWLVKKGFQHMQAITKKDLELYKSELDPNFVELPIE
jgi:hypothetical protein